MKSTYLFSLILTSLIFLNCSSSRNSKTKVSIKEARVYIDQGMTKQEVVGLIGLPGDRQFKGREEVLQYCESGWNAHDFLMVWFFDKKVVAMSSYKTHTCPSGCAGCFKTIDWLSAPDEIIELRTKNI